MHPQEYRAYKSGAAKKAFEEDLAKRRLEGGGINAGTAVSAPVVEASVADLKPTTMIIDVDGEKFKVSVEYGDFHVTPSTNGHAKTTAKAEHEAAATNGAVKDIIAPLEGKFYLTKESSETPLKVGQTIKAGDLIGYVEAMKTFNAIRSDIAGTVAEICYATGSEIEEDDVLIKIK